MFEDDSLLVLNKPAGLVCHPTKGDEFSSLISRVRIHLGGPGFLVNRLDRETSGVILTAKNSEAAGQLGKLWERREVEKEYLAITHGTVAQDALTVALPLGRDDSSDIAIKDCVRDDGAHSSTDVVVVRRFERDGKPFTLVRAFPRTGRKHQIRIHLAAIGHAIVGDKIYGADKDAYLAFVKERLTETQREQLILANHALCAIRIRLRWRDEPREFRANPDAAFLAFADEIPSLS